MAEIRFMKSAARFLKKLKDKKLKELYRQALEKLAQDPTLGQEKQAIWQVSAVMIFITIKPITNWPIQWLLKTML